MLHYKIKLEFCNKYGDNKYSQVGQELRTQYLLDIIHPKPKTFCVEFGAKDGYKKSNTRRLVDAGWEGLRIDKNPPPKSDVKKEWITKDNVIDIFRKYEVPETFGFLSVDIDGNDWWVLREILQHYRPSIIQSEFNLFFQPHELKVLRYDPERTWRGDVNYGASFCAFDRLLRIHNYSIVLIVVGDLFAVDNEFLRDIAFETPKYRVRKVVRGRLDFVDCPIRKMY